MTRDNTSNCRTYEDFAGHWTLYNVITSMLVQDSITTFSLLLRCQVRPDMQGKRGTPFRLFACRETKPVISPFPRWRFNSNNTACNISGHEGGDTEVLYSWLIASVLLLNLVYTFQARWNAGKTFIDDYEHLLSHLSLKTRRLKITVEQKSFTEHFFASILPFC